MIKFKEFDVGDNNYEEQLEQFQTEHPTAEFVQITGGYTSYEKIWFKYEPSDISDSTDKLSVEKIQEQLNTAKKALTEIADVKRRLEQTTDFGVGFQPTYNALEFVVAESKKALAEIGGDDE
ncbi:hypothetical protein EFL24_10365 [Lactococcus cremoris]|uniref:hypothetical protein n=1 Tax=Lactococcus lactis subsp. cremoris TaxID=1359 RepID=UPI00223AADE5|nr:hypothetical protein [Lactococcus cremoris]MCT0509186.1 hypothetical protein [Lactococcus cremoris]